jgi:hypothetical protein
MDGRRPCRMLRNEATTACIESAGRTPAGTRQDATDTSRSAATTAVQVERGSEASEAWRATSERRRSATAGLAGGTPSLDGLRCKSALEHSRRPRNPRGDPRRCGDRRRADQRPGRRRRGLGRGAGRQDAGLSGRAGAAVGRMPRRVLLPCGGPRAVLPAVLSARRSSRPGAGGGAVAGGGGPIGDGHRGGRCSGGNGAPDPWGPGELPVRNVVPRQRVWAGGTPSPNRLTASVFAEGLSATLAAARGSPSPRRSPSSWSTAWSSSACA